MFQSANARYLYEGCVHCIQEFCGFGEADVVAAFGEPEGSTIHTSPVCGARCSYPCPWTAPFRWVDDNDRLGTLMPFGALSTP